MISNLDNYRTFYYVAATGSMNQGAALLNTTPPTVTRSIRALEDKLGCPLFIRSKTGVRLTPEGATLYRRVKPAFDSLEQELTRRSTPEPAEAGEISVGMLPFALPETIIEQCLPLFRKDWPDTRVNLVNIETADVEEQLLGHQLDMVIGGLAALPRLSERCVLRPLYTDFSIPVAGPAYADPALQPHTLEELARIPLVFMSEKKRIATILLQHFQQHGIICHPSITVYNVQQQIIAAESGLGYTFVPCGSVISRLKQGTLVKLNVPIQSPTQNIVCLLCEKDRALTPAAQAFRTLVIEQFQLLSEEIKQFQQEEKL